MAQDSRPIPQKFGGPINDGWLSFGETVIECLGARNRQRPEESRRQPGGEGWFRRLWDAHGHKPAPIHEVIHLSEQDLKDIEVVRSGLSFTSCSHEVAIGLTLRALGGR